MTPVGARAETFKGGTRMLDVITIGEILVEILTDHVGQVFYEPGRLLGPYPSGAPAIFIDQAARMGAKAAIVAKVGRDDFARVNLDRLSRDGVDVNHVIETADNSTGVAFVTYFPDGERQYIFHFSHAACGELCPGDVDPKAIGDARYLHIMGCSITGSPTMGEAIMRAVRQARESGGKISFDPNIRPELLKGQIMEYYQEILDGCDVLLTGRGELELLLGGGLDASIRQLLEQRDRIVVLKDGSRGAALYTRREAFRMGTYPAREADPTGAGDCFDATFLAGLCADLPLEECVRRAAAAGAKAVEKRGPMEGNTTREELEAFMASVPAPAVQRVETPYRG